MRVLLDGQQIESDGQTLAGAMEAGRANAEREGRVIIEVLLDGAPIQGDSLDRPSADDIGESEVRMVSSDPVQLVQRSLIEAADALEATREAHTALAEQIQSGVEAGTLEALSGTLSTWQAAQDVLLQGWTLLGRDPLSISPPDDMGVGSVAEMVDRLAEELRSIKRGLEDRDMTAVADAVGYELEPMTAQWASLLRHAADETARSSDTP